MSKKREKKLEKKFHEIICFYGKHLCGLIKNLICIQTKNIKYKHKTLKKRQLLTFSHYGREINCWLFSVPTNSSFIRYRLQKPNYSLTLKTKQPPTVRTQIPGKTIELKPTLVLLHTSTRAYRPPPQSTQITMSSLYATQGEFTLFNASEVNLVSPSL